MTSIYAGITRLAQQSNTQNQVLSPGQVIRGKVLKLFPNQQALIQLGNQQLVAQLETPLASADQYWFQVQSAGESLHLKVLSDKKALTEAQMIAQLIQSLGLKGQKAGQDLLMKLLQEQIPFTPKDIKAAFQLLQQSSDKKGAMDTLVSLFSARIPVSPATFEAFSLPNKLSFTQQMETTYQALKTLDQPSSEQLKLVTMLESLRSSSDIDFSSFFTRRIQQESVSNQPITYNLFQKAGLLDSDVSWEVWRTEWNKPMAQGSMPFSLESNQVKQKLQELFANQLPLNSNQKQQLATLIQRLDGNGPRLDAQLALLDKFIDKFQIRNVFSSLENRLQASMSFPGQEGSRTPVLQMISDFQLDSTSTKGLLDLLARMPVSQDSSPSHFLAQLKHALAVLGMDHEHQINQLMKQNALEQMEVDSSIKSLLIDMVQQEKASGSTAPIRFEPLLQLINSAQLVSNQQLGPYVQIDLQIPGASLGFREDINLTFEGQKSESGEINSDFCRVLFYLNLHQLEETIIEMNVQKRNVHLTIYNDHPQTEQLVQQFKEAVHNGLDALQYQLRTLQVKAIPTDVERKELQTSIPAENRGRKGVDLKI
ncbi:hypothetical protein KO561_08785 [Radiobacillus kanasensis]|uniref:hypothetical protein n=1 Tax=Radiobacillus kanasensis TaxID=2844358 RepID=UPI001E49231A|nr:hypothetical protein [Radiobacillus kanasensis]UFU01011.1 hypothetical protein KO561_08785 [Radiobacillus kanasensis]